MSSARDVQEAVPRHGSQAADRLTTKWILATHLSGDVLASKADISAGAAGLLAATLNILNVGLAGTRS